MTKESSVYLVTYYRIGNYVIRYNNKTKLGVQPIKNRWQLWSKSPSVKIEEFASSREAINRAKEMIQIVSV